MLHPDRDGGFTLVEVLVAIALMGMMAALALGGYARWSESNAHRGTAREIQTTMRQAQQQAVTEGLAMCVWFDVSKATYTVYRGACIASAKVKLVGPRSTASDKVKLAGPVFANGAGGSTAGATFYARGTASGGEVRVTRAGSAKAYVLEVEGLTGRVSLG